MRIFLIEFILVLVTGVGVVLVKLYSDGFGVVKGLANSVETDPLIIYPFAISFTITLAIRVLQYFYGWKLINFKNHLNFLEEVFDGIGSGLLSIYRFMIGIAISVPIVWFFVERKEFRWTLSAPR
jgi:hypothetical protein